MAVVLQGVDLDAGQLVPPTIDGRGEFWSFFVALGPDAIYLAIDAWNDDHVYQVQRRDIDTGAVLASAPGFSNVAAGGGIVVASTVRRTHRRTRPHVVGADRAALPGNQRSDSAHSVSTTLASD